MPFQKLLLGFVVTYFDLHENPAGLCNCEGRLHVGGSQELIPPPIVAFMSKRQQESTKNVNGGGGSSEKEGS